MQPKCPTNKSEYGYLMEYYTVIKSGDGNTERPKQFWKTLRKLEDSHFLISKRNTKLW